MTFPRDNYCTFIWRNAQCNPESIFPWVTIFLWEYTAKTKYRNFEANIPRKGISGSQSQFPHSCDCQRFIYSHHRSPNSAGGNTVCRQILGLYKSLTDTWMLKLMFGGMLPLFLFIFTLFEQTYNIYIYYSSSTLMLSSWLPLGRGPPLKLGLRPRYSQERNT